MSFLPDSLLLPGDSEEASTQAETMEGLRKALSAERQDQGSGGRGDGAGSWSLTAIFGRRVRSFRRRFDGMRDLVEAAGGNHPELV
eukprot:g15537.t1